MISPVVFPSNTQLHYQMILVVGKPPGNVICSEASNEKVDLIITGSRGLGTARRTILGSVSDYVVHHASCPVCVVPPSVKKCCETECASETHCHKP